MREKFIDFFKKFRKQVPFLIRLLVYLFIIYVSIQAYQRLTYTFITVEFNRLRPFAGKAPVYYRGFKIGYSTKIIPSKDYEKTLVKIALKPNDLNLPKNIVIKFKKYKSDDDRHHYSFFDIEYPSSPSLSRLTTNDVVRGISMVDVNDFFSNQDPDSLDKIKRDAAKTVENLNATIVQLGDLFATLQNIMLESQENITQTTKNLNDTTCNLKKMSEKLNYSIKESQLSNTFINVETTTGNFTTSSKDVQVLIEELNSIASGINKTMPQIESSICHTNKILENVDQITEGLSETLSKQFGTMRLFFGKPLDKKNNCCKDGR